MCRRCAPSPLAVQAFTDALHAAFKADAHVDLDSMWAAIKEVFKGANPVMPADPGEAGAPAGPPQMYHIPGSAGRQAKAFQREKGAPSPRPLARLVISECLHVRRGTSVKGTKEAAARSGPPADEVEPNRRSDERRPARPVRHPLTIRVIPASITDVT